MEAARVDEHIRYEPDERCPPLVSAAVALQGVIIGVAPMIAIVAVVVQTAGQTESYLLWAIFAFLVVTGVSTALQAVQFGRLGTGHLLVMVASGNFIAVCITALEEVGPASMASLILVSALFQFAMAAWLPLLRRIITPVVSGTALMLIAVSVSPIAFNMLMNVPEDAPPLAAPSVFAITLAVTIALVLRASGVWRLWSLLIGLVVGCAVAAPFGLYDVQPVLEASWFGIPKGGWPGLDLTPSLEVWALLPVFVFVNLVVAVKAVGDAIITQQISRRRPRATNYRVIQGAINVTAVGNLLVGIAGTMPVMPSSQFGTAMISITGVAARSVGLAVGVIFVALALLPKATALPIIIPNPVMGTYLIIMVGVIFMEGMNTVAQNGIDPRKAIVVGSAFLIGVGFESNAIFVHLLSGTWGTLFGNGMLVGALVVILMNLFMEMTSPRPRRLEVHLNISALPKIDSFLRELAAKVGWNDISTERLRSVGEETLSSLLSQDDGDTADNARRLIVVARPGGSTVELEFLAVLEEENLEDRLAYLSEQAKVWDEREISFRLLRHYASSVRHQKYHGLDIITVRVEGSRY